MAMFVNMEESVFHLNDGSFSCKKLQNLKCKNVDKKCLHQMISIGENSQICTVKYVYKTDFYSVHTLYWDVLIESNHLQDSATLLRSHFSDFHIC